MQNVVTVNWSRDDVEKLTMGERFEAPHFEISDLPRVLEDRNVWDQCPVLNEQLEVVRINGKSLWIFLSAPKDMMGDERHNHNRFSLVTFDGVRWEDCGLLMPDGFSSGSREWAGTAHLGKDNKLSLYYTVAGFADEQEVSFSQRLFSASAQLDTSAERPKFSNWIDHGELFQADGLIYDHTNCLGRANGAIKAFRDPFYFKDPKSGLEYILFSGTKPDSTSEFDACIGIASRAFGDKGWNLLPPLITAVGLSYELERAHIICTNDKYYLFWSMHGWTTHDNVDLPTGLYGMVSDSVLGPYEPLNGSGLVVSNPSSNPYQAYSWNVCNDLSVSSFVDLPNGVLSTSASGATKPVGKFGGVAAPMLNIELAEKSTRLIHSNGEGK